MPTKPNMSDITFAVTEKTIAAVAGPGYVEIRSYDPEKQQASVRLCVKPVKQVNGELVYSDAKIEYDVPVCWPSGGGRSMTWGLDAGDIATGIVRKASHDEVDAGSAVPSDPASLRQFSTSDLMVQPGAGRPGAPLPSSAVRSDGQVVLGMPSGEALHLGASTAANSLTRDDLLISNLNAIKAALDNIAAAAGVPNSYVRTATASDRIKVDT